MARTIDTITYDITANLTTSFALSTSAVAEWRLWVGCVAYAIYLFEIVLDKFKEEMEADAKKEVAGTLTWYNDKCYAFQLGRELQVNTSNGLLGYPSEIESDRIIKIASVNVGSDGSTLVFRVAKNDEDHNVVPLSAIEVLNFKNYIDAIKFAGTKSSIISTTADEVKYQLKVYYNPAYPVDTLQASILTELEGFKTSQRFGGVIYRHKLLEAVTTVPGVVTAKLILLQRKGSDDSGFTDIDTMATLHAGYFNYTTDSTIVMTSINDIE